MQADEYESQKSSLPSIQKLTGEGTVINSDTRDPQLEKLPILLDG